MVNAQDLEVKLCHRYRQVYVLGSRSAMWKS